MQILPPANSQQTSLPSPQGSHQPDQPAYATSSYPRNSQDVIMEIRLDHKRREALLPGPFTPPSSTPPVNWTVASLQLSSCWAAFAAAKLLSISFGKKQSRWKFPVGWSWPTDCCLDHTPLRIRAIYSLHRTDWPYCPLLQHNSIQSLKSVIKHGAMWAHFIACAWARN